MKESLKLIFLSCSKDSEMVSKFENHFHPLIHRYDLQINKIILEGTAEAKDEENFKRLIDQAPIILVFLSYNSIAYCYDFLDYALKRQKEAKAIVLPILLRPCDFTDIFTDNQLILPKNKIDIKRWPNLDEAFLEVITSIEDQLGYLIGDVSDSKKQEKLSISERIALRAEEFNKITTDKKVVNPKIEVKGSIKITVLYGDADRKIYSQLEKHLSLIQQRFHLEIWDGLIPGAPGGEQYDQVIQEADIIICLLSTHYFSDHFLKHYSEEIYSLHELQKSIILPILVNPCLWQFTRFKDIGLLPLPSIGDYIFSKKWDSIDDALYLIVDKLTKAVNYLIAIGSAQGFRTTQALFKEGNHYRFESNPISDIKKPIGIFIYNAAADTKYADEFKSFLAPSVYANKVIVYSSENRDINQTFEEFIEKKISKAQIIIPFISSDFLSSEDRNFEQKVAIKQQQKRGEAQIIPILLRPCSWKYSDYYNYKLTSGLENTEPITSSHWNNNYEFYNAIAQPVMQAVHNWQSEGYAKACKKLHNWLLSGNSQQELNLSNLNLTTLPRELFHTNVTFLNLSNNKLEEFFNLIPDSYFFSLKKLDLSHNNLKNLPNNIENLKELETLYLNDNAISDLPEEIVKLEKLKLVRFENNPLRNPPIELVANGLDAIKSYFRQKKRSIYEAKVVLVGRGSVGKTSLMKKILNPEIDLKNNYENRIDEISIEQKNTNEGRTPGISIEQWEYQYLHNNTLRDFTINFWDFGGQEIYHATHQFFLTKRTVYLLVWEWDERKSETDMNLMRWLYMIQSFAGDSPVILVMNKMEKGVKEINQEIYKEKFPNIRTFLKVSAWEGTNIPLLIKEIQEAVNKLPNIGEQIPATWLELREQIAKHPENYISFKSFAKLAEKCELLKEDFKVAAKFYHELGIILFFDKPILKNTIFLKPDWVTKAVYKILDSKKVKDNNGRFEFRELGEIWNDLEYEQVDSELLRLMLNFELCFEILDDEKYVVPELLSALSMAQDWDESKVAFRFEYHYVLLPSGLFGKFLTGIAVNIDQEKFWKDGVILRYKEERAKVTNNIIENKITVAVTNASGYLVERITDEFSVLHKRFTNFSVKKMIPCGCNKSIQEANFSYYFDYNKVLLRQELEKEYMVCGNCCQDVNVLSLLDKSSILRKDTNLNQTALQTKKIKLFYSYSEADEEFMKSLDKQLKTLERIELIESLSSQKILPGQKKQREVDKYILEAQMILILVSPNFIACDYCYDEEMKTIIQRHNEGKVQVIPIILRECSLEGTPLESLQCLPRNKKPIITADIYQIDKTVRTQAITDSFASILMEIKKAVIKFQESPNSWITSEIL